MNSIEQAWVPVIPKTDSSFASHVHSGPLKGILKRGTSGKDSSKENEKHKASKIIALPAPALRSGGFEGRKIWRSASYLLCWNSGKFSYTWKKQFREICVQLGANFVNQPFNKSQLQVLSCFCSRQIHRSIMTEQEHDERYLAAQLACQKLADDLYQDPHWFHKSNWDIQILFIPFLHWMLLCRWHPYQCLL